MRGADSEASGRRSAAVRYTRLGEIEIAEEVFTQGRGGPEIRPFSASAEVQCRGYSEGLQRAMTDFGAENAFAGAATKLKEHYGIEVPVSAVRGDRGTRGGDAGARKAEKRLAREWGCGGRAGADCGNRRQHAAGGRNGGAGSRRSPAGS